MAEFVWGAEDEVAGCARVRVCVGESAKDRVMVILGSLTVI